MSEFSGMRTQTKRAEVVSVRGKMGLGKLGMTQQKDYEIIRKVKVLEITKLPIPLASD